MAYGALEKWKNKYGKGGGNTQTKPGTALENWKNKYGKSGDNAPAINASDVSTYSDAVKYLQSVGDSSASGIMTEHEWNRRKDNGDLTYRDYLRYAISDEGTLQRNTGYRYFSEEINSLKERLKTAYEEKSDKGTIDTLVADMDDLYGRITTYEDYRKRNKLGSDFADMSGVIDAFDKMRPGVDVLSKYYDRYPYGKADTGAYEARIEEIDKLIDTKGEERNRINDKLSANTEGSRDPDSEYNTLLSKSGYLDKEIDALEKLKKAYKKAIKSGNAVNEDDFFGQFGANFTVSGLSRSTGKSANAYLDNRVALDEGANEDPWADYDMSDPEIARAVEIQRGLRKESNEAQQGVNWEATAIYNDTSKKYMVNNREALDDEGQVLPWISKNAASYLPQFIDQTKAKIPATVGGFIAGMATGNPGIAAKTASAAGSAAVGIQEYEVMRGTVYMELVDAGYDHDTALAAANDEALVSGLIEAGSDLLGTIASGGVKALKAICGVATETVAKGTASKATEHIAKTAADKAAKAVSKSALRKGAEFVGRTALNAATEYGEEFLQQGVSIANRDRMENGGEVGVRNLAKGAARTTWDAVTGKNPEAFAEMNEAGIAGAITGGMFGGTATATNMVITRLANAKTISKQNKYIDAIREDSETLDALIEEGKASGKGSVSEKIATEVEKAKKNGNVTRDKVKRLIAANEVYIETEEKQAVEADKYSEKFGENGKKQFTVFRDEVGSAMTAEVLEGFSKFYEAGKNGLSLEQTWEANSYYVENFPKSVNGGGTALLNAAFYSGQNDRENGISAASQSFDEAESSRKGDTLEDSSIVLERDENKYPYDQREVIDGYENSVDPKTVDYVNSVRNMKNNDAKSRRKLIIGRVSDRYKNDVKRVTGIDFDGDKHVLRGSAVVHIDNRHGKNGEHDHSMAHDEDIGRIGWVIENYDSMEVALDDNGNPDYDSENHNSDNSASPKIKISKKINGTYYIVEAVPDSSSKTAFIKSAYISKKDSGKNSDPLPNMVHDTPQPTSETNDGYGKPMPIGSSAHWNSSATDDSIAEKGKVVKRKNDTADDEESPDIGDIKKATGFGDEGAQLVAELMSTSDGEKVSVYDIPDDSKIVNNIVVDELSNRLKRENPRAYSNIIRMARRLRMNVRFVKGLADDKGNVLEGLITSKGVFINADAKNPSRFVATHEFGHRMKQAAPKVWAKYQKYVINKLKREKFDNGRTTYDVLYEETEKAYGKHDADYINEEIAVNYVGELFDSEEMLESFIREDKSLALKVRDWWYNVLESMGLLGEKKKAQRLWLKAYATAGKNVAKGKVGEYSNERFKHVGETDDGRKIYRTNYKEGTPKSVKQNDLIEIIQNIWSKKPIKLTIKENGVYKEIIVNFNPKLSERSDLSKIAFGNRKGTGSEKRMTLDLSADLYQIASDAKQTGSKAETGKDNKAHDGVKHWYYFITNLVYEDDKGNRIDCHMNIDVKENQSGYYFYSFAIEKGTAPQTLLAVVSDNMSPTVPTDNSISYDIPVVNTNSMQNLKKNNNEDSDAELKFVSRALQGENLHGKNPQGESFRKSIAGTRLSELVEKYGAIPKGEKPARDVSVPKKTSDDKKVSRTSRTVLEAKATPDVLVPTIQQMIADGTFSYETYSDKEAIADAEKYIKDYGWDESLEDWFNDVGTGVVSKHNTVLGWALYNNAANIAASSASESERATASKTALRILDEMIYHQRNAAQALQATRVLKKLSPETQLYGVQRTVRRLGEEIAGRKSGGKTERLRTGRAATEVRESSDVSGSGLEAAERIVKKGAELHIDEALAEKFLSAKTQEERDDILIEIYRDIGRQMPATLGDKWNAWRYLSMLCNLRTHGRNIVGNLGFAPVVFAKDLTANVIESIVYPITGKRMERSKALIWGSKADRALLSAAWKDYANVADLISGGGKYSDRANANKYIEEGRRIFKTKPLEQLRRKNSAALEYEDVWFSKPHYAYALATFCKANNISPDKISDSAEFSQGENLHGINSQSEFFRAREYAIREAQKATYKDTNVFSQMVSDLGKTTNKKTFPGKVMGTVVEGILPFRKTPANILVRGVEYSPVGLLKGLTYDLARTMRGEIAAHEAIDNISAGLTGTGLMALGIFLASQGLVRGHGEDEEEKKDFMELMGHQSYALELPNGTSVTLDWLAPEALPFFVGVNLWETTKKKNDTVTLSTILAAVTTVTEPMMEMSCLQGLNDLFEGLGYASSNDTSGLVTIVTSSVTSYLTQGIPTLFGQLERTSEKHRMTTYTEKDAFLTNDLQYTLGKISGKIPFWDFGQIPYIDAWGRKESSASALSRGFNNFLNPSYTSSVIESDMEKELLRLYEVTGDTSVFPERAKKYFNIDGERKDLSADEYVQYATLKGQNSYKTVSALIGSKAYMGLSDDEKVKAIADAYTYADGKAKQSFGNYSPEKWVGTAEKFGDDVGMYLSFRADVASLRSASGDKITKSQVADIICDVTDDSDMAWLMYSSMYDSKGMNEAMEKGVDAFDYIGYTVGIEKAESDGSLTRSEVADVLSGMDIDDDTAWALYLNHYDNKGTDYAIENGIEGNTYLKFIAALDTVDKPTESGKYGTYTQDEAKEAINSIPGLSRGEKAVLWQSVNTQWKDKNNPFR